MAWDIHSPEWRAHCLALRIRGKLLTIRRELDALGKCFAARQRIAAAKEREFLEAVRAELFDGRDPVEVSAEMDARLERPAPRPGKRFTPAELTDLRAKGRAHQRLRLTYRVQRVIKALQQYMAAAERPLEREELAAGYSFLKRLEREAPEHPGEWYNTTLCKWVPRS